MTVRPGQRQTVEVLGKGVRLKFFFLFFKFYVIFVNFFPTHQNLQFFPEKLSSFFQFLFFFLETNQSAKTAETNDGWGIVDGVDDDPVNGAPVDCTPAPIDPRRRGLVVLPDVRPERRSRRREAQVPQVRHQRLRVRDSQICFYSLKKHVSYRKYGVILFSW